MDKSLHTVILDNDKCKGCIACMKRCPTEAIRVRNGKASVLYDRCIGCAECVRICPHQAKLPAHDPLSIINDYKYKIALPAPALYSQFNNLDNIDIVLNGLLEIGFDDVFEVSVGAELVSQATKEILAKGDYKKPAISTACPAVVELIMVEFHSLRDNLLDLKAPVDVSAELARERAIQNGIKPEDIGVFFISPCPAKVFALKSGLGLKQPNVDGVIAISEIYFKLTNAMSNLKEIKPMATAGSLGVRWSTSGGESLGINNDNFLAADGVENVLDVLKAIENSTLDDIDFVELNSCPAGCVGGVLNMVNPFVARSRNRSLRKNLPPHSDKLLEKKLPLEFFKWDKEEKVKDVFVLDENRLVALQKMDAIERIYEKLPHLDCGSCGAPSCEAFAEDIVNGCASIDMCPRMNEVKNEN